MYVLLVQDRLDGPPPLENWPPGVKCPDREVEYQAAFRLHWSQA